MITEEQIDPNQSIKFLFAIRFIIVVITKVTAHAQMMSQRGHHGSHTRGVLTGCLLLRQSYKNNL